MVRRLPRAIRVLHVTPEFPPVIWGGLGTAVGGLTNASAQAGMTVGVLLVGGVLVLGDRGYAVPQPIPEDLMADGWLEAVMNAGGVRFFHIPPDGSVEAGLRLARAWKPDVIHLHTAWLLSVAFTIREQFRTPLVFTVHSLDRAEYEFGGLASQWEIQDSAIRLADRVIAISRSEADLLAQHLPEVRDRVRIVGNGIDDCEEPHAARRSESPLVLYSGRFVDRKGIRELLAAIPLVLERAPTARFVLVGGYGSGAEIERQWLVDALRPFRNSVRFTGWLTPREVAEWYRVADVLVVPSWYEPFGMVILEGMLHGLPIAATDVGGPAEILEHGRTGILFAPKSVGALAEGVLTLVTDADLRHRIGAAAADEVRRRWLWPRLVGKFQAVYQEIISPRPPREGGDPALPARPDRRHLDGDAEYQAVGGMPGRTDGRGACLARRGGGRPQTPGGD